MATEPPTVFRVRTPCPPAALGTKFPPQDTLLLLRLLMIAVRTRLGRRLPCPVEAAVSTLSDPGIPASSRQEFALPDVIARLVTWLNGSLVVTMTYT